MPCGLKNRLTLSVWIAVVLASRLHASQTDSPRSDTVLDSDWQFQSGEFTNAPQLNYDAAGWQVVTLPHDWGWKEAQAGRNYYRGPGWYRRQLVIAPQNGRRYFLRFGAAATVADVYLNQQQIGQHRGGFGAFCFEITTNLDSSGTNLLAVRVSNAAEPDVAPLSGDFSVYGGLYRPVHLIETGPENFTLTDHSSAGVAWLQTAVGKRQALLEVSAEISNSARSRRTLTWMAEVEDAEGRVVASNEQSIALAPSATAPYILHLVVPQPHLWNGRVDPYLYLARVKLVSGGQLVDQVDQPLGLRSYRVDPTNGFFLNGKSYSLHGVDRHQDRPDKGWAISEADMMEDVGLLTEIGATVVRCAHYEHSDYFYSLCDRAGILVWAELPQVNAVNGTPQFEDTSRNQLLDLIRQNINHPSIFVWSLFNEIGDRSDDPHRELQDLNEVAHAEDPTRPTIAATCTEAFPQMNRIPDLLGWNIYPGWYSGKKEDAGSVLDKYRQTSQSGGFCVSEYGAGANITQHEENPRQPKTTGQWHPEEYQSELHEALWSAIHQRPFVWGSFVWNMFDFAVSTRHEGGVEGRNDKGLVTYDRKVKKDAFYFYKANWSSEPVLYITSRRFTDRTNAVTPVKIYSNAKAVDLLVNGESQGELNSATNGVFVWKDVQLRPGPNRISAHARKGGATLQDDCIWNLRGARPAGSPPTS